MSNGRRLIYASFVGLLVLSATTWLFLFRFEDLKLWLRNVEIVQLSSAKLAMKDSGEGAPAIILINGVGVPMAAYSGLQDALAEHTRVVAFDRPGVGYSPENNKPKTLPNMDRDLHELVGALDITPPYILVGHSFGGHIMRFYALQRPSEVAGLVFLDAPHENWLNYIRENWPEELIDPYFSFWRGESPGMSDGSKAEIIAYETNNILVKDVVVPPSIPVLMFTGNNAGHFRKDDDGYLIDRQAWADSQASMVKGVVQVEHIVDWEAGHWIHNDKPMLVESKIIDFLDRIRKKQK